MIFFSDATPKTEIFLKILSDPSLTDVFAKVAYAKVEYKKDSEDAKKLKVTSGAVLLILDNSGDMPKELKKMTGGTPKSIKTEIEAAVKKMSGGK